MSVKQIILKLSIIISAIIIVCQQYNVFRYATMHYTNPSKFESTYKNLERADKNRTVATIHTPDSTVSKPLVNSLLDQTVKIDAICVNQCEPIDLNESVKKYIDVYKNGSKTYKTENCFISVLLRERDASTKIILIDNGMVYGPDFIEELIDSSNKNPNKIIYGNKQMGFKGGILFSSDDFSKDVFDIPKYQTLDDRISKCAVVDTVDLNYKEIYPILLK